MCWCDENESLCSKCIEGYFPDENGGCSYTDNCEISYKGKCLKCKNDDFEDGKNYCANEVFGCIATVLQNCIRCDNILDLYSCTECEEGYEPNPFGVCYRVFNWNYIYIYIFRVEFYCFEYKYI